MSEGAYELLHLGFPLACACAFAPDPRARAEQELESTVGA
jgi:hypothetical protein